MPHDITPTPLYSPSPLPGERQLSIEEGESIMFNVSAHPTTHLPISPPLDAMTCTPRRSQARRIHIMAMWSKSNISRTTGTEEWSVFSASDPIHLESPPGIDDPYLLRYGDTFVLKIYNDKGNRQTYMHLRALSIMEPDSPFFMLIRTWSSRNNEVILRIPIGFISTSVDTLLRQIDKTTDLPANIEVAPTVLLTDDTINRRDRGRRFISRASRDTIDPENTMNQYVLLLQDM